jgi:hypothetical protein
MGQKPFVPQEYDVFAGLDVAKKRHRGDLSQSPARSLTIIAHAVQYGAFCFKHVDIHSANETGYGLCDAWRSGITPSTSASITVCFASAVAGL